MTSEELASKVANEYVEKYNKEIPMTWEELKKEMYQETKDLLVCPASDSNPNSYPRLTKLRDDISRSILMETAKNCHELQGLINNDFAKVLISDADFEKTCANANRTIDRVGKEQRERDLNPNSDSNDIFATYSRNFKKLARAARQTRKEQVQHRDNCFFVITTPIIGKGLTLSVPLLLYFIGSCHIILIYTLNFYL